MTNAAPKKVTMYTTPWCPYCLRAKALLKRKNVPFEDIDVSADPAMRVKLREMTGQRTVPQIFIEDQSVGGCDELHALDREGTLDSMLSEA